jgi:hypothetical protein
MIYHYKVQNIAKAQAPKGKKQNKVDTEVRNTNVFFSSTWSMLINSIQKLWPVDVKSF